MKKPRKFQIDKNNNCEQQQKNIYISTLEDHTTKDYAGITVKALKGCLLQYGIKWVLAMNLYIIWRYRVVRGGGRD